MIRFFIFLSALLFAAPAAVADESWPLKITAGPDWEIDYQGDQVDFFSLDRPAGENVFFIFSRWPTGGGREQIPIFIDQMAKGFESRMSGKLASLMMKDGFVIEAIPGKPFSGQAAVFTMRDGSVQTLFMVSDGDGIWNGQFNGSRPIWDEAKLVLGSLSRTSRDDAKR